MRVHDLIAQPSIPWPPPITTSVRPFENLPVASEVRPAVLESVFWGADEARPWIDLQLQFHGRMLTASLVCGKFRREKQTEFSTGTGQVAMAEAPPGGRCPSLPQEPALDGAQCSGSRLRKGPLNSRQIVGETQAGLNGIRRHAPLGLSD
jgi:hypothetical protein